MFLVLSAHKRCPYFILIWVRYKVYFVSSKPDLYSNLFFAVLYVISCYIGSYWKETTLYKVLTIWYKMLHGIVFSPNIEAWTKWLIFCQWLFLMLFIERRYLCLDTNISLQFAPSGPVDNEQCWFRCVGVMMKSSNGKFSALLAICAGNSPVPGEFPTQRPVKRSFDVFFDLLLNKRWSKHSWGWWFEMLPRPLWRHCYVVRPQVITLNNVDRTPLGHNMFTHCPYDAIKLGGKQINIGPAYALSTVWCQAITQTNAALFSTTFPGYISVKLLLKWYHFH